MIQSVYNLLLEILIHIVQTKTFRIQDVQHSLSMVFEENEAHDETLEFHQDNAKHLQVTLEYALFKKLFHDIQLANAASTWKKKIEWVMRHVYISIFSNIYDPRVRPDGPLQKDHLPPPKDAISHHPQSMQVWRLAPVFGLQRVTLLWSALKASAKKKEIWNVFKRILQLEEQGVLISRYAPPLNNHRRPPFLGQHSPHRQC